MTASGKRGLGRGLDALLGISSEGQTGVATEVPVQPEQGLRVLPVDVIQRGRFQPRVQFDQAALQELADSIRTQGIVQPIVVRRLPGEDRYEIIAGERRWRAAQLAGLHELPVIVRNVDDRTAMSVALIENIQRQDLNAIEEAAALHRLVNEFGLTHEKVAEAVGRSRTAVTNLLRLLELAEPVRHLVEGGELEMGHARALLPLPYEQQLPAARHVVDHAMSVRQAEAYVKHLLEPAKPAAKAPNRPVDPNIRRLEQDLSERLGARVELVQTGKSKGTLVVHYNSLEELDGILSHIH
ncbi:MAG: ParB/RepB/Spo0J family partition protein [Gammaproteobacteria bacterium]